MLLQQSVEPFQGQMLYAITRKMNSVNKFDVVIYLEFDKNGDYMQF